MRRSSVQRTIAALIAVLIAVLVSIVLGASPASARPANPHDHSASARQHRSSEHARQHVKSQSRKPAHEAPLASSKAKDDGLGGLGGLLNSIINGTLPTIVKNTGQVVSSTVKTTTDVVKTTTDVVTIVLGGTKTSTAPTPPPTTPTTSTPKPSQPTTASTHSNPPASPPTTVGIAAPGSGAANVQQVQIAPLQGPNLVAASTTATHKPTAKPNPHRQVDAITPASLLTAPGTGLLIGVVIIFGLGVFVVVYGAGYRGRRVH